MKVSIVNASFKVKQSMLYKTTLFCIYFHPCKSLTTATTAVSFGQKSVGEMAPCSYGILSWGLLFGSFLHSLWKTSGKNTEP